MKCIGKIFAFLSFLGMPFISNAKQVELYFNGTMQENLMIDSPIDDHLLESPWHHQDNISQHYCQEVSIENRGHEVLENCMPFVNQQASLYTLEGISQQILKEKDPLLALYHLWNQSIFLSESITDEEKDPLYLLNVMGCSNKEQYTSGFVQLCLLMGMSARPANIYGEDYYDFSNQSGWKLFDLFSNQLYFSLNNRSLASSEEVMDDPFLALRTKYPRKAASIDFKKAWENLAHFEILTPCLEEEVNVMLFKDSDDKVIGFDLYPGEKLIYQGTHLYQDLLPSQCSIQHLVDPQARQEETQLSYSSPFPIRTIYNGTSSPVLLKAQDYFVQPGETLALLDSDILNLDMSLSHVHSSGYIAISSTCSWNLFPKLSRGTNLIHLGTEDNPTTVRVTYELNEEMEILPVCTLKVVNHSPVFDHSTPLFLLEETTNRDIESIWWQISPHSEFDLVPSNFEQVQPFTSSVTLPAITDTFFNPGETYFFRVKGCTKEVWGEWSEPFAFSVKKPQPITDIELAKLDQGQYQMSWEDHGDATDYLIFGSNSLDFIPSVYCDIQINALVDGEVIEEEPNQNLVAITSETKFTVDGSLAYYRIIARHREQLSVPSPLTHIYDQDLSQTRTVLQLIEKDDQHTIAKRAEFPTNSYAWLEAADYSSSLPVVSDIVVKAIANLPFSAHMKSLESTKPYTPSPYVTESIWNEVRPYLLPENHPVKPKLDRMFSARRVTLSSRTFKRAGFPRSRIGRVSHVMASNHPELLGYYIKAFADTDLKIKEDWKKWIIRIQGAHSIRKCIERHGYQAKFKVPNKWIYPLPPEPSPPHSNQCLRKNFILVAEDMKIYDQESNKKRYKTKMTTELLNNLYTILQEEGLFDSVYAFNVPFSKDGKLAFVDTEHHHRWPVPFYKLNKYFSSHMAKYWKYLIANKGPKY